MKIWSAKYPYHYFCCTAHVRNCFANQRNLLQCYSWSSWFSVLHSKTHGAQKLIPIHYKTYVHIPKSFLHYRCLKIYCLCPSKEIWHCHTHCMKIWSAKYPYHYFCCTAHVRNCFANQRNLLQCYSWSSWFSVLHSKTHGAQKLIPIHYKTYVHIPKSACSK